MAKAHPEEEEGEQKRLVQLIAFIAVVLAGPDEGGEKIGGQTFGERTKRRKRKSRKKI